MKDIVLAGLARGMAKLILAPISVGLLWLALVHFQAAQAVGVPSPTIAQIILFVLCVSIAS